jgi:DNA-binding transcriptional LysR family regulator
MEYPHVSLDQWRALLAVHDHGGYAQAAAALHRSQSAVHHAVKQLEERLGVRAFELQGRKAVLTDTGRMLVRRGRALLDEALRLERAAGLAAAGWETELRIAVEIIFPSWLLLECLDALSAEQPHLRVQVFESVLSGTTELLQAGRVDMAIASRVPAGFVGDLLMNVRFVAAAAPHHPLHQLARPLTREDLRHHRHLIVRDTGQQPTVEGAPAITEQRWTVSAKATSIRAACMGLGFAWYAEDIIARELVSGELKPLPLTEGRQRSAPLYLVFADPDTAGPGARQLAQRIRQALSDRGAAGPSARR